MKTQMLVRCMACMVGLLMSSGVQGAVTLYGPSPYLQTGDAPTPFDCKELVIETFEDNALDSFLSITPGVILAPNFVSGSATTDSVDGDDGIIDGFGNNGYSWYAANVQSLAINFANPVAAAGLVFTDGDALSSNISLEAFDSSSVSLGIIGGDLADNSYLGETAEDRFMGFVNTIANISKLVLTMNGGGGIEIDHIQWRRTTECTPEPGSMAMVLVGCLGALGWRRGRP